MGIGLVDFAGIAGKYGAGDVALTPPAPSGERSLTVATGSGHAIGTGTAPELTEAQIQDNRALKKDFIAALQGAYDSYHVLEVAAQIRPLDGSPLSVSQIRSALTMLPEHRLLLDRSEQESAFERLFPRDASTGSALDEAIAKHKPPGYDAAIDREALRGAISHQLREVRTPLSPYLMQQVADKAVRDHFHPPAPLPLAPLPLAGGLRLPRLMNPTVATSGPVPLTGTATLLDGLNTTRYFGCDPKAYFDAIKVKKGEPCHRDWHINQAVLRQLASTRGLPLPVKAVLEQRALGYLYKFASVGDPARMGWQSCALQPSDSNYHRGGQATLFSDYRSELSQGVRIAPGRGQSAMLPVSSAKAMDALKRQYEFSSESHRVVTLDAHSGPRVFGRIVTAAATDSGNFLLDITQLAASIPGAALMDANQLRDALQGKIDGVMAELERQVAEYVAHAYRGLGATELDLAPKARELMQTVRERLLFGASMSIGDQPTLFLAGTARASAQVNDAMTAVSHAGYTAGPSQILQNWAALSSLDSIVSRACHADLPTGIELPGSGSGLEKFTSYGDFMQATPLKKLGEAALAAAPKERQRGNPAVHVLGRATLALLEGLGKELAAKPGARALLNDAAVQPTVQYLYNRILSHVQHALDKTADLGAFVNHIQLANEEIATLLAVLAPHQKDELDLSLPRAGTVSPRYEFRNSGMNAFNSILSGAEAQKHSRELNVMALEGTYYEESLHVLQEASHYKRGVMRSDAIAASIEQMREKLGPDGRLDLFLAEFHHNISTEKHSYKSEDLVEQIKALLAADPPIVAGRFTVAIDSTIAFSAGKEIVDLLDKLKTEIQDGRLNLVLFRSGQKFDMAGLDHYNAGFMASYGSAAYGDFAAGARDDSAPAVSNLQGMIHFQKHARGELDTYRSAIMNGHLRLLRTGLPTSLPSSMVSDSPSTTAVLRVAPNTDKHAVFLDIRSPFGLTDPSASATHNPLYGALRERFIQMADAMGLTHADRASFGFPHTNVTMIGMEKLRITLGLEDEKDLKKVRDILAVTDALGVQAQALGASHAEVAALIRPGHATNNLFRVGCALLDTGRLDVAWTKPGGQLTAALKQPLDAQAVQQYARLAQAWAEAGFATAAVAILAALKTVPVTSVTRPVLAESYMKVLQYGVAALPLPQAKALFDQFKTGVKDVYSLESARRDISVAGLVLAERFATAPQADLAEALTLIRTYGAKSPADMRDRSLAAMERLIKAPVPGRPSAAFTALEMTKELGPLTEPELDKVLHWHAHLVCNPALQSSARQALLETGRTHALGTLTAQLKREGARGPSTQLVDRAKKLLADQLAASKAMGKDAVLSLQMAVNALPSSLLAALPTLPVELDRDKGLAVIARLAGPELGSGEFKAMSPFFTEALESLKTNAATPTLAQAAAQACAALVDAAAKSSLASLAGEALEALEEIAKGGAPLKAILVETHAKLATQALAAGDLGAVQVALERMKTLTEGGSRAALETVLRAALKHCLEQDQVPMAQALLLKFSVPGIALLPYGASRQDVEGMAALLRALIRQDPDAMLAQAPSRATGTLELPPSAYSSGSSRPDPRAVQGLKALQELQTLSETETSATRRQGQAVLAAIEAVFGELHKGLRAQGPEGYQEMLAGLQLDYRPFMKAHPELFAKAQLQLASWLVDNKPPDFTEARRSAERALSLLPPGRTGVADAQDSAMAIVGDLIREMADKGAKAEAAALAKLAASKFSELSLAQMRASLPALFS